MRLLLVRHGESEGNAAGIVQGHVDFGLSPLGRLQAKRTAERLVSEGVTGIVTSPLRRARETAAIIAAKLELPFELAPGLMEYDMGEASGLTWAEIRTQWPDVAAAYARGERPEYPGEEGRARFHARIRGTFEALHAGADTVVAVAHGGVVNAVCAAILGVPETRRGVFHAANC
jgi:broad specificity phosphatase PhoE